MAEDTIIFKLGNHIIYGFVVSVIISFLRFFLLEFTVPELEVINLMIGKYNEIEVIFIIIIGIVRNGVYLKNKLCTKL